MEQRILRILVNIAVVIIGCYCSYIFLNIESPEFDDLIIFAPFGLMIIFSFLLPLFENITFITQMDPVTIIGFLLAMTFVVLGFFAEEKKSKDMFSWAFSAFTFIGGYEAGKVRQKMKNSNLEEVEKGAGS